ncbi:outer membrane beta-barrel family protein [Flavobacterium sp. ov086]|uniref:outer membrane beta-barrel family protein n=1 Tax=Flavobacterium sp. ov086 TaxID=1761785 RepID=UPI000B6CC02F|nr:outer membrane beta-barrel family protein [Flavobacterium sp. ov086]SNR95180.1 Outer membrane receptor proteins, mostly Fe transport [Flavobacterium sp. ov086]
MNKVLVIVLLLFISNKLFSQIIIQGQIKDQNNKSIEFAEILIKNKDSLFIKSELTNAKGRFLIKLEKGEFLLIVKDSGIIAYQKNINVIENLDLGVLVMNKNDQQLKEVIITSKKKIIERKNDRLVFNVENSITSIGGDAMDALRVTPGLKIQNDQIMMIGKSGMSVMIDDKIIHLYGEDLISFLKTIKSDNIKSIEVITAPPAKYDVEGNSGIVNIKLKKAKKNSWGGDFNSSYTKAKFDLGSIGSVLNYQKNKITINYTINYTNGSTAPYQENYVYYPKVTWFETNHKRSYQNNLSNRFNFDYQLTKKTTIGMQYTASKNKPLDVSLSNSKITDEITHQLDSLIVTPSYVNSKKTTHTINFYSLTKLDSIGRQLFFDTDYFEFNLNSDNNFSSNYYYGDGSEIPNRNLKANNITDQKIKIYSSKIDLDLPLQWVKVSFGAKVSFIKTDNNVAYYNFYSSEPILDLTRSNLFNYSENTQALYISAQKSLAKKWDLQLGLRAENTQTKGVSATVEQLNTNTYIRLFPTLYLTYTANENSTFSFNYNRRIDRPSYADLNPFRLYSTAFNYMEGNPFLQPYFTNNIEISHSYKDLYSSLSYKNLTNGIDYITVVSADSGIQIAKPYNFYTQNSIVLSENYTFSKWKGYENNIGFNLLYAVTSPKTNTIVPEISNWTASFSSYNSFVLNKKKSIRASLDFVYSSPSVLGSYKLESYYFFDAGMRMSLFEKKVRIAISMVDIFRTNKLRYSQVVNNIKITALDYSNPQSLRFSLSYYFGKSFKKDEKTNTSNEDEKSRVK